MQSEHKKTACVLKGSHIAHGLWLQTQRLARSIWSLRGVACIAKSAWKTGNQRHSAFSPFPPVKIPVSASCNQKFRAAPQKVGEKGVPYWPQLYRQWCLCFLPLAVLFQGQCCGLIHTTWWPLWGHIFLQPCVSMFLNFRMCLSLVLNGDHLKVLLKCFPEAGPKAVEILLPFLLCACSQWLAWYLLQGENITLLSYSWLSDWE